MIGHRSEYTPDGGTILHFCPLECGWSYEEHRATLFPIVNGRPVFPDTSEPANRAVIDHAGGHGPEEWTAVLRRLVHLIDMWESGHGGQATGRTAWAFHGEGS